MSLRIPCLLPVALAVSIAAPLAAQLPAHHAVVGTVSNPSFPITYSGTTGVFFVRLPTPGSPGPFIPIQVTGLPPALTVGSTTAGGAHSVLHRPSDGRLFVGDRADTGSVHVHILTLTGKAVSNAVSVPLGTLAFGSGLGQGGLALFPDGRVLVTMGHPSQWISGPGSLSPLGILDTTLPTPVLAPILFPSSTPFTGLAHGCALSPDGGTAFVTTHQNNSSPPFRLYKVIVDPGNAQYLTVTLLHTWQSELAFKIALHPDGMLYAVGFDPVGVQSTLYRIDTKVFPVVVTPLTVSPSNAALGGPALEPATGQLVFASAHWAGSPGGAFANSLVTSGKLGGTLTLLAAQPAAGWGIPFAIDIIRSFDRYGVGTPAANSYRIVDCPNPGGLPQIGTNFSITVRVVGGNSSASWMMIGFNPDPAGSLIQGVSSFVQPPWIVLPMTTGSQAQLALPVPNNATLLGAGLYAQGVHIDPGGLATSDAVRIEIMQ